MANDKVAKAYKVSPELKDRLERLAAESGLETQEQFIEQLAAIYELQQLKEGNGSGYLKQIEELQYHTNRSLALFVSMIDTEAAARMELMQAHDEKLADRAVTITLQEQTIIEMQKEKKTQTEELSRLAKENESLAKLVDQLQESLKDKATIADQHGQEVATLSSLVNEYKAAADENKELKNEVTQLTSLSNKQATHIESLQSCVESLESTKTKALDELTARHEADIERIVERKDVEREKMLLELRNEYQTKREATSEESTAKMSELYAKIEQLREKHALELQAIKSTE